ncbi:hypothetical protein JD276_00860 [Leucobacter sp. CSA1]|uniref:histidine kinase n=1 Tax=Leucobacter chromiisoli TaxID=2796471 RepID=A0A934UTW9_9MICO|nr:hypothetical protein [Leucobacter chromiisoli]
MQEERLRIARDLHDTVGHQLAVAALHASVAEEALGAAPELAPVRAALERVRAANAETLRELRGAVRLLRSDGRDPLGIAALARTAEDAGLRVSLDESRLRSLPPLPPLVAEAAGRILTEAVTNVLRHASASTVRIDARVEPRGDAGVGEGTAIDAERGTLLLLVADDGVGAEPGALEGGHGLAGMRERAALVGGSARFAPEPGRGSAVRAELPLGTAEPPRADAADRVRDGAERDPGPGPAALPRDTGSEP